MELGAYLYELSHLEIGGKFNETHDRLLFLLGRAIAARRGVLLAWQFGSSEKQSQLNANVLQLMQAAGQFRAAQNIIAATA